MTYRMKICTLQIGKFLPLFLLLIGICAPGRASTSIPRGTSSRTTIRSIGRSHEAVCGVLVGQPDAFDKQSSFDGPLPVLFASAAQAFTIENFLKAGFFVVVEPLSDPMVDQLFSYAFPSRGPPSC
jgi:hypothetical protein